MGTVVTPVHKTRFRGRVEFQLQRTLGKVGDQVRDGGFWNIFHRILEVAFVKSLPQRRSADRLAVLFQPWNLHEVRQNLCHQFVVAAGKRILRLAAGETHSNFKRLSDMVHKQIQIKGDLRVRGIIQFLQEICRECRRRDSIVTPLTNNYIVKPGAIGLDHSLSFDVRETRPIFLNNNHIKIVNLRGGLLDQITMSFRERIGVHHNRTVTSRTGKRSQVLFVLRKPSPAVLHQNGLWRGRKQLEPKAFEYSFVLRLGEGLDRIPALLTGNGNQPGHENIHKSLAASGFRHRDALDDVAVQTAAGKDFVSVLVACHHHITVQRSQSQPVGCKESLDPSPDRVQRQRNLAYVVTVIAHRTRSFRQSSR